MTSTHPGTQQGGDATRRNMLSLKKKAYEIKFELDGTNYIPIENIGSGAYGVVCSAVHKKTKEKVAIKKTPNIFQHSELAKRTYREIKILLHFKHDNIISIREILSPNAGKDLKDVYIVLDLMESDLHQIIHTNQPLTNEHACYFLYQILRGLKYIHSANVIHRDLKPSNLLVNENCDLKIGDFGMARGFSSLQSEFLDHSMTQYVATRWYRAPEIILAMVDYTAAVDVWSVGCIFAEMLGRKQLFPGSNTLNQIKLIRNFLGPPPKKFLQKCTKSEVCDGIVHGDGQKGPVAFTSLYPKASNKARDVLGRMLTFDPDERLTVEAALKHPYLSKYHDPYDEPCCIPAFNFDFENEVMTTDSIKQNILKEIAGRQKTTTSNLTYNIKLVPKEELCKTIPRTPLTKSSENSATTPRTAAAIRQIQEIARQQAAESGAQQEHEDEKTKLAADQIVPEMPNTSAAVAYLKVESDKVTDDVEMLSAKAKEIRIGSPPRSEHPPGDVRGTSFLTSVMTSTAPLTPRATDVEMPSAKHEEVKVAEKIVGPEQETPQKPLDKKALIRAAILNGKKGRSVSESEVPKPRITALQKQREREYRRKKRHSRALGKKKKPEKDDKEKLLSNEDRNMLERWKNMQQSTLPFVHPIRAHMEDIIHLRHTEKVFAPGVVDQPVGGGDIIANTSAIHLIQTQGMDVHAKPVACIPVTVYNGKIVDRVLTAGCYSGMPGSTNLPTTVVSSQNFVGHNEIKPHLTCVNSHSGGNVQGVTMLQVVGGGATTTTTTAQGVGTLQSLVGDFQRGVQGGVSHQVSITGQQPIRIAPQIRMSVAPLQPQQHLIRQPVLQVAGVSGQIMGVTSHPIGVTSHPISVVSEIHTIPSQQTLQAPSSQPQRTPSPSQSHHTWGMKLPSDNPIPAGMACTMIDTPITTPAFINFPQPGIGLPDNAQTQTWSSEPHLSQVERLPSYTEALHAKTFPAPIFRQVSLESVSDPSPPIVANQTSVAPAGPSHSLPSTDIQQDRAASDAVGGVTLSVSMPKGLIESSMSNDEWPLLSDSSKQSSSSGDAEGRFSNSLKVTTLTKMLHKSHMDDLTLAATPKGTGGGYGVGLDLDSLLFETLPMDADQESTRSVSDPPSAGLLADWQELSGHMNQGELEALERDLEMGFPSPSITDVTT